MSQDSKLASKIKALTTRFAHGLTDDCNKATCRLVREMLFGIQASKDTVLAKDLSDVRKNYAKKKEHLAKVRDGSPGEIANGYWLLRQADLPVGGRARSELHGPEKPVRPGPRRVLFHQPRARGQGAAEPSVQESLRQGEPLL